MDKGARQEGPRCLVDSGRTVFPRYFYLQLIPVVSITGAWETKHSLIKDAYKEPKDSYIFGEFVH